MTKLVTRPHNPPNPEHWSRAIALIDMNAFFASVEQLDNPELHGLPIAVTNGIQGTCIITSSYEARAFGVKTGMRLKEARQLCPDLIQRASRPERYAQISTAIMESLLTISPDVEIFSVDEAFLDVTRCQSLLGPPEHIAHLIKQAVFNVSGLLCSVGISGDKTTAKYAAKQNKPDGLTVVHPSLSKKYLHDVPVTDICGIGKGIGEFLAQRGVYVCGDMQKLPISELGRRFGNIGRRIWKMCLAEDPDQVTTLVSDPKSIGHGKVMPPDTRDRDAIYMYLLHMCEKVATRLRRYELQAKHFYIGFNTSYGWLSCKSRLVNPTQDGRLIYRLGKQILENEWQGQGIFQLQVSALDPHSVIGQLTLFKSDIKEDNPERNFLEVMDDINMRYGELCLAPARLLSRSEMPDVISPTWRPSGQRQTICKAKKK